MTATSTIARILLGLVFLVAGAMKAMHPHGSAIAVGSFQVTPPWLSLIAGLLMPSVEVVAGAALLLGRYLYGACFLSLGLVGAFMTGVISVMQRQLDLECGCFGHLAITPRAGWGTLTFDLFLLLLTVLTMVGVYRRSRT